MTSQVRANSKCLTILSIWLCRALELYGMEISHNNDMDRVWDTFKQGCGVGVETGVGVGRSRPFCLESESELESIKFRRLRLQSGVAGYHTSTDTILVEW